MKVAVVTAFPAEPSRPNGGVEAVSVNLVEALSRLEDLTVDVITAQRGIGQVEVTQWEGITVHRLPRSDRRVLLDAIGPGRSKIREYLLEHSPDIVHAHDTYGLMVKGLPIPRVFTIHGFIYGDTRLASQSFARLRSRIWEKVEKSGWADQPHIISISPYVRERLSGITEARIHDIDNPIAPECFQIKRSEKPGTVFSAAAICARKNQLRLVEAFARVLEAYPDAELRLAGGIGEHTYGNVLEQKVLASGLERRVKLLGPLSGAQIRQELATASVFALVSLEENSPMGIEEAMAAGVPVVTSNRCGMPYMVRDGESGYLIDPHDPADIAWRIGQLLKDDQLRSRMGRKSEEIAKDRFNPDVVARRTRDVYLQVLRDNGQQTHRRRAQQ